MDNFVAPHDRETGRLPTAPGQRAEEWLRLHVQGGRPDIDAPDLEGTPIRYHSVSGDRSSQPRSSSTANSRVAVLFARPAQLASAVPVSVGSARLSASRTLNARSNARTW